MKILILAVNPKKTEQLRLDEEIREIQLGLERSKWREQFEVVPQLAVRTEDLRRSLLDHQPQIVHFCGHGTGQQGLLLENDKGEAKYVSNDALSSLFKLFSDQVKCVLLNACYSEIQAQAIHQHIEYVIGMNQAIGDRAAIKFSTGFYDALGAGRSIENAFEFGLSAIEMEGISESLTPKILIKQVVKPPEEETSIEEAKQVPYVIVLTAKLSEVNRAEAEAIFTHLKQLLGDENLRLTKMEEGSVVLVFEGSEYTFEKLKSMLSTGQLSELFDKPVQSVAELRFYLVNYIAHNIAQAFIEKESDVNELMKAASYLRIIINESDAKTRFFRYLETLARSGNQIGHSGRTISYYRTMNEVCKKYLLDDDQIDAHMILEIIGWSARLMRYYRVTPIGEIATTETGIEKTVTVSERQVAIEELKSTQAFEEGQIIEAQVEKKQPKGNKVTYLIGGVPFTEKEPKTFDQIPASGTVKVQIKSLKKDGSVNHIKFFEP